MNEVTANVVAGIFTILVLFWLFNPRSNAAQVIGAIGGALVGETQALQGYSPRGGGQFYGGGA